jgi:hypothetical protein
MKKILALLTLTASIIITSNLVIASPCSSQAVCKSPSVTLNAASGTTAVNIYTVTGNGAKVVGIYCTAQAQVNGFNFKRTNGGITYPLYTSYTPINQPAQNTLTFTTSITDNVPLKYMPIDESGNQYLILGAGDVLSVSVNNALTTTLTASCTAQIIQY